MELYLIRHGLAVERGENIPDEERSLTEKGRQKTASVAQRLGEIGVRFDVILCSPLLRAKQTGEILLQANLSPYLQEFQELAPDGSIENWLKWLGKSGYNKDQSCLALVGHQPDLGNWAEILIWGQTQEKLVLKKTGVIALQVPTQQNPIGQSQLFLLTSPKWL